MKSLMTEYSINKCKELSLYDTKIDASYGDKLITLPTCKHYGVVNYSTSTANGETLYTLKSGQKRLDGAYFAFYEIDAASGTASILGKGTYRTNGTTMTVSNMPLLFMWNST